MPRILPMDVVTYATGDRASLSTKVAPPYDVLDDGPKQQLLARDPHNIVEIDLPVTPPKTVGPDEAYQAAAKTYKKWLDEGVLKRHDKPCVVAYEEQYEFAGQTLSRRGLFAGCGLEPFNQPNGIFRHEMTIPGGVNDRYKLTEATGAQLSPVFSVFDDPDAAVVSMLSPWFDGKPADLEAHTEHDDVLHRCWIVDDEDVLKKLETWFAERPAFIADGHHRYTTALKFHEDHPEMPAAEKGLMVLVAAQDPGMIVKAYHRVVTGLQNFSIDALQKACDELGGVKLEKTTHGVGGLPAFFDELPKFGFHAMGLFDPETKGTYALSYADPDPLASSHASRPNVWRELDVAVLQHHLVEHVLMPRFGGEDIEVKYTAELPDLVSMSGEAPGRLGVIMQPTPLKSVMDVARADDVMPAKSTFFFPKLASGLVIHPVA